MDEENDKDLIEWIEEQGMKWFGKQEKKAWEECKQGELLVIPEEVIERLPPPFAKRYKKETKKYGGVIMNKLKLRPTTKIKFAFSLGFLKAWDLVLGTDEGFKWARYHYEQRKKKREKQEDVSK